MKLNIGRPYHHHTIYRLLVARKDLSRLKTTSHMKNRMSETGIAYNGNPLSPPDATYHCLLELTRISNVVSILVILTFKDNKWIFRTIRNGAQRAQDYCSVCF